MKRGRKAGVLVGLQAGSVPYQLAALQKQQSVMILCKTSHSLTMQGISVHFQRVPALIGMEYRQRALYCVQPGRERVIKAVLVERIEA